MKLALTSTLACALLSVSLCGQSTSQIDGTVRDSTGSVVPGAVISATQTATGFVRTVESSGGGSYLLPSLPVGPYRLEVRKDGFTTYVRSGVILQVNSSPTVDVTLAVG